MRRILLIGGVCVALVGLGVVAGLRWSDRGIVLARACGVLTAEFAAEVIGPSTRSNDDISERVTQCQYLSTPVGLSVNLSAERYKATKKETGAERARRLGLKHRGGPFPGLGEEAYFSHLRVPIPPAVAGTVSPAADGNGEVVMGRLLVLVEDVIVTVSVGGRSLPEVRESSGRLARAYLTRLDA